MFYLEKQSGEDYFIRDTSDNSLDKCSLNELLEFKKLGINIAGFSFGVIEPLENKFQFIFALKDNLYGVTKYGEVNLITERGYKNTFSKMFFSPSCKVSLLSKHKISNPKYDTLICTEEKKLYGKQNLLLLKTQVFKVNTTTHDFTKVDEMEDFAVGKHRVLRKKEDKYIYYGSKQIAKGL